MNKKIIIVSFIAILLLITLSQTVFGAEIDTSKYSDIYSTSGVSSILRKGSSILGIIQVAGTGIAVIMLIVLGIRYIIASVEEKAQLKETLIPYVIGAILLFGGTNLLSIVIKFVQSLN